MSDYFISLPSIPSPPPSPPQESTNTLTLTSLPKSFFDPLILNLLRNHFSSYGAINQWVPLPGFGRIIIVYDVDHCAELAKQACDPIILKASHDRSQIVLRVYRADRNPLVCPDGRSFVLEKNYLQPPPIEKNFLISPPGSPPVGWEQIKEEPPNASPLADDLIHALQRLQMREQRSGLEVLLDPMDGSGVGVYVEDCDAQSTEVAEEDWVYGESMPSRMKWGYVPTAMPPMSRGIFA